MYAAMWGLSWVVQGAAGSPNGVQWESPPVGCAPLSLDMAPKPPRGLRPGSGGGLAAVVQRSLGQV